MSQPAYPSIVQIICMCQNVDPDPNREDKLQELRRKQEHPPKSTRDGEMPGLAEETSTFIELSPDNLSRVPEKGILKHGRPENWEDGSQDEQGDDQTGVEVERTLKSINGYHEEILEALHSASQRIGDSKHSPSQELHKNISDLDYASLSIIKGASQDAQKEDEDEPVPGPIRIRNLEDLLRQLEHHPLQQQQQQHVSPACSDEIRLSEPEADRHYLLGRQDRSGSGDKIDPSLQYLIGRLQAGGASAKSTARHPHHSGHYSVEEDDDDDDDDDLSGDDEGSTYSSHQLVRSASEEALPVSLKKDYEYAHKVKSQQGKSADTCDYVPSPPSEDSYANSSEENAFLPPSSSTFSSRGKTVRSDPQQRTSSTASTGSLPSSSKRKARKKGPEYKV